MPHDSLVLVPRNDSSNLPRYSTPNLRVEGPSSTIFEGTIVSGPRNITVSASDTDYFTYYCDGVHNNQPNPSPFNTALDALDAASKSTKASTSKKFTYDGRFNSYFDDFIIDQIAGVHNVEGENPLFWGLLYNWKIPARGNGLYISGCATEVHTGDNVLWAWNATEHRIYLKVTPGTVATKKGTSVIFTVTDGLSGVVQPGAKINGIAADNHGKVVIKYSTAGTFTFKATKSGATRSNLVKVTVS